MGEKAARSPRISNPACLAAATKAAQDEPAHPWRIRLAYIAPCRPPSANLQNPHIFPITMLSRYARAASRASASRGGYCPPLTTYGKATNDTYCINMFKQLTKHNPTNNSTKSLCCIQLFRPVRHYTSHKSRTRLAGAVRPADLRPGG